MKVVKEFQNNGVVSLEHVCNEYEYDDLYILVYNDEYIYSLVELNNGKVRLQDLYGHNIESKSYENYINALYYYLDDFKKVEVFETEYEYYRRLIEIIKEKELDKELEVYHA